MADDKKARNKQARDEERRQRERELQEAREREDEAEPVADDSDETIEDLDEALERHDYPATTDELIEAYGDDEFETEDGRKSIEEALAPADDETYDSADAVRDRIRD